MCDLLGLQYGHESGGGTYGEGRGVWTWSGMKVSVNVWVSGNGHGPGWKSQSMNTGPYEGTCYFLGRRETM